MGQSLESAARVALHDLERSRSNRSLVQGLDDFVNRRFRGGAASLRRVHEARSALTRREGVLADLVPGEAGPYDDHLIADVAGHSAPIDLGRLLYCLVRAGKPRRLLELGTNIGVSAAYIATAIAMNKTGRLVSIDFSRPRLVLADELLRDLGLDSVDLIEGDFDEVLPAELGSLKRVDFAYIDGDHERDSTLAYFEMVASHRGRGAIVVCDDIRWSKGMYEAWESLVHHRQVRQAIDLGRLGLIVVE